jgi:hypothetical protein
VVIGYNKHYIYGVILYLTFLTGITVFITNKSDKNLVVNAFPTSPKTGVSHEVSNSPMATRSYKYVIYMVLHNLVPTVDP